MANTIITKNSSTASAVPTSGDLVQGELAVNVTDKRLFTENAGGTVVEVGTNPSTIAVAGNATVGGTLGVTGATTLAGASVTSLTNSGNTTLGDASTDTVTVNGYMGVGGAGNTARGVNVVNDALTGTSQIGVRSGITGTSGGTALLQGFASTLATAAASYTVADVVSFIANNPNKGAGSTITNLHGLYISDQTQGTNNYGITSLVSSGTNKWNIYASGTAANYFAGNVGIGTSSPLGRLHVSDASTANGTIYLGNATYNGYIQHDAVTTGAMKYVVSSASGGGHIWYRGATDYMTLDSSGNLLVGPTPNYRTSKLVVGDALGGGTGFEINNSDNIGWIAIAFHTGVGGSLGGYISTSATSTSYNTSSDYRLKEDWQPMTGASERVKALKPVNFAWKVDGSRVDGFLAHEAQEVVPEAVTGVKDATEMVDIKDEDGNVTGQEERPVYQGIDQSKLVPLLTAALQEALTKIDSLTARIEALEGN